MLQFDTVESERSGCVTIQSENLMHSKISKCQFDYLNAIRDAVVKRLQK